MKLDNQLEKIHVSSDFCQNIDFSYTISLEITIDD